MTFGRISIIAIQRDDEQHPSEKGTFISSY